MILVFREGAVTLATRLYNNDNIITFEDLNKYNKYEYPRQITNQCYEYGLTQVCLSILSRA